MTTRWVRSEGGNLKSEKYFDITSFLLRLHLVLFIPAVADLRRNLNLIFKAGLNYLIIPQCSRFNLLKSFSPFTVQFSIAKWHFLPWHKIWLLLTASDICSGWAKEVSQWQAWTAFYIQDISDVAWVEDRRSSVSGIIAIYKFYGAINRSLLDDTLTHNFPAYLSILASTTWIQSNDAKMILIQAASLTILRNGSSYYEHSHCFMMIL